jgi:histone H3/H4
MNRAKEFMNAVWDQRNKQGADTEEKLVSSILKLISETAVSYNAQDGRVVLDKNDILQLAEEIVQ